MMRMAMDQVPLTAAPLLTARMCRHELLQAGVIACTALALATGACAGQPSDLIQLGWSPQMKNMSPEQVDFMHGRTITYVCIAICCSEQAAALRRAAVVWQHRVSRMLAYPQRSLHWRMCRWRTCPEWQPTWAPLRWPRLR